MLSRKGYCLSHFIDAGFKHVKFQKKNKQLVAIEKLQFLYKTNEKEPILCLNPTENDSSYF